MELHVVGFLSIIGVRGTGTEDIQHFGFIGMQPVDAGLECEGKSIIRFQMSGGPKNDFRLSAYALEEKLLARKQCRH